MGSRGSELLIRSIDQQNSRTSEGFTIVELLIVIVVIAILAAISIVAYTGIQQRARDNTRISDLKSIQKIVELYKVENGTYPLSSGGNNVWGGLCAAYGNTPNYIVGISTIVSSPLPIDPKNDSATNRCYLYRSNGVDYMALAYLTMETICGGDPSNSCNSSQIQSMDRAVAAQPSIAVWSTGAANW